jgi:hypothetical protein
VTISRTQEIKYRPLTKTSSFTSLGFCIINLPQMRDKITEHQVFAVGNGKFIVQWRGQTVRSTDGGLRYFENRRDARDFLELCDTLGGIPAVPPLGEIPT